ncbi:MAG: Tn3 family transposase, partial [Spirosoma sp.]
MPTIRSVLDKALQQEFENPPLLNYTQRKISFSVDEVLRPVLRQLETPVNQVGFLLQLGYFKLASRFFTRNTFRAKDWAFVISRLQFTEMPIRIQDYTDSTMRYHRQLILSFCGAEPFRGRIQLHCQQESDRLIEKGLPLQVAFGSLCEYLRSHRWEIPSYSKLAVLIHKSVNHFQASIEVKLNTYLQPHQKKLLNDLLDQLPSEDGVTPTNSPLLLTQLRDTDELLTIRAIRQNAVQLRHLKDLYYQCQPVMQALNLPEGLVETYALQLMRGRAWQVKLWKNRELYLLCFIEYQYFYVSDVLIKTFATAVQEHIHQCDRKREQHRLSNYQQNLEQLRTILLCYIQQAKLIQSRQEKTTDVLFSFIDALSDRDQPATQLFLQQLPYVEDLFEQLNDQVKDIDYLERVEAESLKLQARVGDIMRHVEFQVEAHATPLKEALLYFQKHQGQLGENAPIDFLPVRIRSVIKNQKGKLRVSLYKALLARQLMRGLKNGLVYVPTSHQHRSIDAYLIDEQQWQNRKSDLLQQANMSHLTHWSTVRERFALKLKKQLRVTTDRIQSGKNQYFEKRRNNSWRITTPTLAELEDADIDLFPQDRIISLFEILETVNRSCDFLNCFESARSRHGPQKPSTSLCFAAIMSLGCNLTTDRLAKASKNISASSLETTVRNYFNSANLVQANNQVSSLIERISRSGLIPHLDSDQRTASDGQKFKVIFNSIHSTYSGKYFGKDKGITIYSFINNVHNLFYSTVFSASDREAWYVIDGLLHNDVIRSSVHTTDSHGATEPIFAVSYLLGIDFQPRMSHVSQKLMYSMDNLDMNPLEQIGCTIGPPVDERLIEVQWDRILKLLVTFKLKHNLASLVMKRLNSYAVH